MSHKQFSTGHVASPYMQRFRLPILNAYRSFDDLASPSEELAKWELITTRMSENNKVETSNNCTSSQPTSSNYEDTRRKTDAKLKLSISDPFFHPRRLFGG